eukprot:CAMPEP_0176450044 /NCGR_PEP_ID=MMETSP0127-20121128/26887_1 /TAXON_ID=938130 /ORGANISM="Platyophrya macrostoma, Strain WH" /LENGTH=42 /DNA_ID= /DNA_START= /DNA_END= /DNA_ORIENTATION=
MSAAPPAEPQKVLKPNKLVVEDAISEDNTVAHMHPDKMNELG